jgi:membrane associated rhomboid family serine protease
MFVPVPLELKRTGTGAGPAWANALLIAVNVVLFALGSGYHWGWAVGPGCPWWNVLAYGFTHAGVWHLVGNMWALYVFGNAVNRRLGNAYYLAAYLGPLVALGLFARLLLHGYLVGASGAVFSVIIMALILMPRAALEIGYVALFPVTLLLGLMQMPSHWSYWFVRWGRFSLGALWCLAVIPLMEVLALMWNWGNLTNLAHLLGMALGVAVVLMLPTQITMPSRPLYVRG